MSELKEKILSKLREPVLASFATITEDGKPWSRYVAVISDENLNIWFATFSGSRKIRQLAHNPEVHLNLGVTDLTTAESYLQIQGRAEILNDIEIKKAVWYDHLANIFSGPEDPLYCVCKIVPYVIEYNTMEPGKVPEVWTAE